MELSRRINLRLSAEQFADVAAFARQRSLRAARLCACETPAGAVTPLHAVAGGDADEPSKERSADA